MAQPTEPVSTSSPEFKQAVTEVLRARLDEIREHFATALEKADHLDAAEFLRNYREDTVEEEVDRG